MNFDLLMAWMRGERVMFSPQAGEVRQVSADAYLAGPIPAALIIVPSLVRAERIAEGQRARRAARS